MDFPKNIKLDTNTKERLTSYLNTEIENHRAERSNWVAELTNLQQDYLADPAVKEQTFPFKGACNIVIPLTAIAVEAVHAREMTTMFALDQFTTIKLPPQFDELTADLEIFFDDILLRQADFYKFCDTALLENKKLGTCVGKSGFERIVKRAIKYEGDKETPFDVVVKQGPTATVVPLANFLMPFVCDDPQLSPWCGEEHTKSPYEVKVMSESGFFYDTVMKELENFVTGSMSQNMSSEDYRKSIEDFQQQTPIKWPQRVNWFEIWLSFDVDGDGKDEEIVVHYHYESKSFFSIRYNWYEDLHRPYRTGIYFPIEHRWAGIGIAKQNEQFQKEVTTQHRQRIDNATLANLRMFKVKQGLGYGPNEPVFPGKIWEVENKDDVDSVQMAEIYPSSYNNEQQAVVYSNQRTGVTELTLGMPQVGTPGTATSDLSRVQESSRRFDYTYKNSRRFTLSVAKDVICNVSQYGPANPRVFETLKNGQMIEELLQLPKDQLRAYVLDNLQLAGQNANRLVDRNTWLQIGQVTQQYFEGAFAMLQMMGPMGVQLMPLVALRGLGAITETYKQLLEAFDIRTPDKLILPVQQLGGLILGGSPNGPKNNRAVGPGNPGSESSKPTPGMDSGSKVS